MRRLLPLGVPPHGEALDPLPALPQLPLAELQVVAPAGDRGDRLFQAQLAFLEYVQRRIELRQRLLIGERLVEAHGTASSTVASSRPADSSTLMGCPWWASSALRTTPPPTPSRVML